jgi:hypothetical protein
MTVNVRGMGIREYLGQGEYWLDTRTDAVYLVSEMDQDKRIRAARSLSRRSTALISLAEAEALRNGELSVALRLSDCGPREWMIQTALYRALYPEPAGVREAKELGNQNAGLGVVPMYGVPRSA